MEKSVFEEMVGTYRREGDYLLPKLELPDTQHYQIGKYGLMRKSYLKDHHPGIFAAMSLNGTLFLHLAEIDRACNERMKLMVRQMAEREGMTEALKASVQLEWVGRMNSIRNRAEEIVLNEVVYN